MAQGLVSKILLHFVASIDVQSIKITICNQPKYNTYSSTLVHDVFVVI